jgi:DNA-binding NtrC family response regulator
MKHTFVLVGNPLESTFKNRLEKILGTYGKIEITSDNLNPLPISDMVIIDATEVEDFIALVKHYYTEDPNRKIIVATAVPTWQRARQAIKSGAYRYIEKNISDQELYSFFSKILDTE